MLPVFVRRDGDVSSVLPTDLESEPLAPDAEIAARPDGPFLPMDEALVRDPELREALATAFELPSIRRYAVLKAAAWAGLLPLIALAELDRELGTIEGEGAFVRALVALAIATFVGWELSRPTPRHPATLTALFAAATLRLTALLVMRRCGSAASGLVWVAPALGLLAALAVGVLAPSTRSIDRAILARISPAWGRAPRRPPEPRALPVAVAIALGLPLLLAVATKLGSTLWVQAAVFVGFAALAPRAVRAPPSPRPPWRAVGLAVPAGFALTLGLASAAHYALHTAAGVLRCVGAGSPLDRLLTRESLSFGPRPTTSLARFLLVLMTVLVVPWAEERIYRGVLQRALVARFGRAPGVAIAALAFGASHFGVYGTAFWQAVLLGVGFGAAFEEGGLLVATAVHAVWNGYLLF